MGKEEKYSERVSAIELTVGKGKEAEEEEEEEVEEVTEEKMRKEEKDSERVSCG